MQETDGKKSEYSKNEKFLKSGKVGRFVNAIAFAVWSVLGQNENDPKHSENDSRTTLRIFHDRKRWKKTANIPKIIRF